MSDVVQDIVQDLIQKAASAEAPPSGESQGGGGFTTPTGDGEPAEFSPEKAAATVETMKNLAADLEKAGEMGTSPASEPSGGGDTADPLDQALDDATNPGGPSKEAGDASGVSSDPVTQSLLDRVNSIGAKQPQGGDPAGDDGDGTPKAAGDATPPYLASGAPSDTNTPGSGSGDPLADALAGYMTGSGGGGA